MLTIHIFKIYLAERMKDRSTLSIFSSFWYASWVGFLTWKKAKQFEQTHPVKNLISETQLKWPNVMAADILHHHRPSYPALSTTTLQHLLSAPGEFKYLHTHRPNLPTFKPLPWNPFPHISAWPNVTYSWLFLQKDFVRSPSFLGAINPSTMSHQKL